MSYGCARLSLVNVDFESELWVWEARRAETWTFVSLPADAADEITDRADGLTRGFGSLRVRVRIGITTWTTSIFPDAKRKTYVLPVKKAVRRAESLQVGGVASVSLEVLDV